MKKFIFWFIAFIVILGAVILWKTSLKNSPTTIYSSPNIKQLILEGFESMNNMNNISFEIQNSIAISKHYFKGNKKKLILTLVSNDTSKLTVITDLDIGKAYSFDENPRIETIQQAYPIEKGIQYTVGCQLKNTTPDAKSKIEYRYIKSELLEEKDCILVEEETFYRMDDGSYAKVANSGKDATAYWIEKSTGFILAYGKMQSGENMATPETYIRNIQLNSVTDDDFIFPSGYRILER